jgi:hypothetical protein
MSNGEGRLLLTAVYTTQTRISVLKGGGYQGGGGGLAPAALSLLRNSGYTTTLHLTNTLTCWQQQRLEWLCKPAQHDGLGGQVSRHLHSNTCNALQQPQHCCGTYKRTLVHSSTTQRHTSNCHRILQSDGGNTQNMFQYTSARTSLRKYLGVTVSHL